MDFKSLTGVAAALLDRFTSLSSTATSSLSTSLSTSVSAPSLPPPPPSSSSSARDDHNLHMAHDAMQTSASLQDFPMYVKVRNVHDEEVSKVIDPHAIMDEERPLVHPHTQLNYSPKKALKTSILTSSASWCKAIAQIVALLGLFLFAVYVGYHWYQTHWKQEKLQYSIVLDCGSTSTRVQVYAWTYRDSSGNGKSPVVIRPTFEPQSIVSFPARKGGQRKQSRAYHRMESEPGLHKLLSNESGIKGALDPLLQWAEKQVPRADHGNTPLFLLATAGVRKLESEDAEWLLDKAWAVLERSPFMCKRSWVKVISGTEEAYYGWVSLNYNFGRLGQTTKQLTLGALDLGGSSLQVTFESEEVQDKDYQVNLSVGSTEHHLYALSHAGFGLNDAFDKSVALVLKRSDGVVEGKRQELEHPCLHKGFRAKYRCLHCRSNPAVMPNPAAQKMYPDNGQPELTLVGKPDWESCNALASAIINNASMFSPSISSLQSVGCDSEHPCALGRHQPEPEGKFYALSGFFVVYKFFGLRSDASFSELLEHGKAFCEKPWQIALDGVVPQPLVEHYCFRAPYVVSLLQDGLHLKEEQITVGSGDITWTLGAALLEAGAFSPSPASRYQGFPASRGTLSWDAVIISVLVLIMMALFLFTLKYFLHCFPFGGWKSQSPLGPSRYSPSYFARLRLGKLETGVWNGDTKMPHSPAPLGSSQDESQSGFGLLIRSGKSMLELSQLQVVAGYKSQSKLSSRRTQSRDDLIKYVKK